MENINGDLDDELAEIVATAQQGGLDIVDGLIAGVDIRRDAFRGAIRQLLLDGQETTAKTIQTYFEKYGYLADTHTAVAANVLAQYRAETGDDAVTVFVSTASPYKFAADVLVSLGGHRPTDDLEALDKLSELTKTEITAPLRGLGERQEKALLERLG